jgi:hypothetical protein
MSAVSTIRIGANPTAGDAFTAMDGFESLLEGIAPRAAIAAANTPIPSTQLNGAADFRMEPFLVRGSWTSF